MRNLYNSGRLIDARTTGLPARIELASRDRPVESRAFEAFGDGFDKGVLIRASGENIALCAAARPRTAGLTTISAALERVA